MDKNLIEKYRSDMLKMYSTAKAIPTNAPVNVTLQPNSSFPKPETETSPNTDTGKLIAVVTTLRSLYPLNNAIVRIFTGDFENMQIVAEGKTDQSGKTEEFILKAPSKALSLNSKNEEIPYALYNMQVSAEGYLDNIHLNIPVFSGITSIQSSNMMLLETAGKDKGPQIFDEAQNYGLN